MLRKAAQRPARQGHEAHRFQAQEHAQRSPWGSSIPRGGARGGRDVRRLAILLAGKSSRDVESTRAPSRAREKETKNPRRTTWPFHASIWFY
eukprot:1936324-Amphidinium_carterae.1